MGSSKVVAAKIAVGLAVIPVLVCAYSLGPNPGNTGAPGNDTCDTSGCHVGTPLNGGGGNVQLTSSMGTTYTPGQQQTFTITINDSKAKVYGFQMTARVDGAENQPETAQAGNFTAGPQQLVLCALGDPKGSDACPDNQVDQYIEHSSPFPTNTITVAWTAPSTNVGTVTIYVAANAASGNTILQPAGDHIYTTQLTLCPVLGSSQNKPAISTAQSAGGFNAKAGIAPGTWMEIYGSNFAAASCVWQGADFSGTTAPTTLGGVNVTIGGKNAYVDYVSSGQVNAQVPDGISIGSGVPLVLTNSGGASAAFTLQTSKLAPAILAPAQAPFSANGKQYVVAQRTNQAFAGYPGSPAKPGDLLTIYGIGFGPVNEGVAAGTIAPPSSTLTNKLTFFFNQTAAAIQYQGLAPGFVGLYQLNVIVPKTLTPGDYPIKLSGETLSQNVFITVGQ